MERGFTLVEMIVAVGLFAVVMVVSVGSLLSIVSANRKAQGLQSVMNNLSISLDGLVRAAREGDKYHGGSATSCGDISDFTHTSDCTTGADYFAYRPIFWTNANERYIYWLAQDSQGVGRIYRDHELSGVRNDANKIAITSSNVNISQLKFYVVGSCPTVSDGGCTPDNVEPKVIITVVGTAGTEIKSKSTFHIQATAVQRSVDL